MLTVTTLTKKYGARNVLDAVSFSVTSEKILALVGPSGSGKSTLLGCIGGYVVPTAGRVYINGHDVTDIALQRRNVGLVFQDYSLFATMSVKENVRFPAVARYARAGSANLLRAAFGGARHINTDQVSALLDRFQISRLAAAENGSVLLSLVP
jgi:putative spermidine/putrescine transport system ATP-binding protein